MIKYCGNDKMDGNHFKKSGRSACETIHYSCGRPVTLKDRIKRAMESVEASQINNSSVFTAAAALASLAESVPGPTQDNAMILDEKEVNIDSNKESDGKKDSLFSIALTSHLDHVPMLFPQKLMQILSNKELSDIITWLPHGKGFIILQKQKFASEVMPLYFKYSKFTSFTRKLNRWNFTRITRGAEAGAYYHKYFRRDDHHLCMRMHCQSSSASLKSLSPREDSASFAKRSPIAVSNLLSSGIEESPPNTIETLFSRSEYENSFLKKNPKMFAPNLSESNVNSDTLNDFSNSLMINKNLLSGRMHLFKHQQALQQDNQKVRMAKGFHSGGHSFNGTTSFQPGHIETLQNSPFCVNQPVGFDNILGVNTASRNHPLVIRAAVNALQSCNGRAYLDFAKAKGWVTTVSSKSTGISHPSLSTSQSLIHAAIQAQIEQVNGEYYRTHQTSMIADYPGIQVSGIKTQDNVSPSELAAIHNGISQQNQVKRLQILTKDKSPHIVRRASAA